MSVKAKQLIIYSFYFSFTDADGLAQLPNETEVLIFNGNKVPFLRNNVLGMVEEHELLKVIDMSNNGIQEITGKAFHKVRNVEKLILDHNDISISGKQMHFYRDFCTSGAGGLRGCKCTVNFLEIEPSKSNGGK